MKIHQKITLVSSVLFGVVFIIIAIVIYFSFNNTSSHIFYGELTRTAQIAGMFYLEKDELTKAQYEPIEEAFYNLSPDQKISIYDEQGHIAFDTEIDHEETVTGRLDEIRKKGILNFKKEQFFYHGLFYEDNQGDFVVLVKAESPLIQDQLANLILILIFSFLLAMTILVWLTSWLSKLAYKPVRHTINEVNTLNLNQRPLSLDYKPTGDELEELFEAFNGLLHEIEQTYEQQKYFVDYASHELKTPLAGIINHLEVNLKRQRSAEEYREMGEIVLQESENLRDILKNLLTFSSLNRVVHQKEVFRVDELVWEVIEKLSKKYGTEKFEVNFLVAPEEFEVLNFKGNPTQFSIALLNLVDNAAKFSGKYPVVLSLKVLNHGLQMEIKDQGIGMVTSDLKRISQPFFRAQNATEYKGSGLGVSIAIKVLSLHKVDFDISSKEGVGTTIQLIFPKA